MKPPQDNDQKIIRVFSAESVRQFTLPEINAFSVEEWEKFYRLVEILLSRYAPVDWAKMVATELRSLDDDPKLLSRCPPHIALGSIEASCAYTSGQNLTLTPERFYDVVHTYMNHSDPVCLALVATEIAHWLIVLAREQLALQVHPMTHEIAQLYLVFNDPVGMRLSLDAFHMTFGMSPVQ